MPEKVKDAALCIQCHGELTSDDIGMSKKLINRGMTKYYCIPCLARYFEVDTDAVIEKMNYYKSIGCTLFPDAKGME